MSLPTALVMIGWTAFVAGIWLLSIPWALIIGGATMMALGLYAAKARINATGNP